jgi:S1-C subfamily serine protease
MRKAPLYSRSRSGAVFEAAPLKPAAAAGAAAPAEAPGPRPGRWARLRSWALRHERRLWPALLLLLIAAYAWNDRVRPGAAPLNIEFVDRAMRKSLEEKPLPSKAARAYEEIQRSVVRVVGIMDDSDDGAEPAPGAEPKKDRGIGTGVAIMDNGTILTNLHVVAGAKKIKVTFFDGLESEASLVNVQPENDLAVLRARKIPDDLLAATMRSTGDLRPGDEVMAVGFPFGIGPSASAGVVSGLKREFRSPEGDKVLSNLIQFDAAANPGNSGGPLVTMDGEVVGIVTAILNPSRQRVFIGIGFAVPIENAASAAGLPPF